jgi:glycosyltransferase involved in cell wall biosynthesis
VIEALAAGLPIVSTGFGVEGLDLIPMKDYLHAESAIEFATQIHKITSNNELAIDLSERGKATAKNRFSIEFLEGLIRSVIVK